MSKDSAFRPLSKKRKESLARAVTEYGRHLQQCQTYLTGRGITQETAGQWGLGLVVDPMPGHEGMVGRLAIPYLTPAGPVALKFRCIRDHECGKPECVKYLCEDNVPPHLFGVLQFKVDSPILGLCEGEMDAIVASQSGLPSVGVAGTHNWLDFWHHLFEGYDEVLILADGDEAGRVFAQKIGRLLYNSRIAPMPTGQDVTSFVIANGADALRERVGHGRHAGHEGAG